MLALPAQRGLVIVLHSSGAPHEEVVSCTAFLARLALSQLSCTLRIAGALCSDTANPSAEHRRGVGLADRLLDQEGRQQHADTLGRDLLVYYLLLLPSEYAKCHDNRCASTDGGFPKFFGDECLPTDEHLSATTGNQWYRSGSMGRSSQWMLRLNDNCRLVPERRNV